MNNFFRRLKKKALLKELKIWTDLMEEYNEEIVCIDKTIEEDKDNLFKQEESRLKQLKAQHLEAYNNAKLEAERITKELKSLD